LGEDEELAATPRAPKETGESVDDQLVDVRIPIQDEELLLAGEDLRDCRRNGLRPIRVRSPFARRASERVCEGLEIVAGGRPVLIRRNP